MKNSLLCSWPGLQNRPEAHARAPPPRPGRNLGLGRESSPRAAPSWAGFSPKAVGRLSPSDHIRRFSFFSGGSKPTTWPVPLQTLTLIHLPPFFPGSERRRHRRRLSSARARSAAPPSGRRPQRHGRAQGLRAYLLLHFFFLLDFLAGAAGAARRRRAPPWGH